MLHLLYGKDSFRSKRKLNELLDFFCSKTGRLGIFKIGQENFNPAEFEELAKSTALFWGKFIVVCERLLENNFSCDFVSKNLELCARSKNIFLFLEEDVEDNILDLFKERAEKIQKFDLLSDVKIKKWIQEEIEKKKIKISYGATEEIIKKCANDLWCVSQEIEKFSLSSSKESYQNYFTPQAISTYNPFSIGDAIANKQKRKAWILLQGAFLEGVPAEEIFWKIWWQIKNLLLVKKLSESKVRNIEKESGLHPFVIKKALLAIKNFSSQELNELSWKMVDLYHKSKRGIIDLELGLEKFIIS